MKKKVVDEAPNVELNSPETTPKKDPKRKKLFLIFLGIGLALVIALFCYLFMDKIVAIFDKYAVIENKGEEVEEISDADAQNTLHFYKTPHDETNLYVYNDVELVEAQSNDEFDGYPDIEEVGKYNCKSYDCKGYYVNDNNVFIKDAGNYLYDYVAKTKQSLAVTSTSYDYYLIEAATYNNKLYGLFFPADSEGKKIYYSLDNKKSYEFTSVFDYYENHGTYYITNEEGYFAFDITDNSFIEMPFSIDDYDSFSPVSYRGELYGYSLHKNNYSGTDETAYAFYSIKDKKVTIASMASPYAGAEVLNNYIISNNKLYNFSTGELLHDFSNYFEIDEDSEGEEEYFTAEAFGNTKGVYYFINTDIMDGNFGYLLDKNFNALFNSKTYFKSDVGATDDGDLIIRNEDENLKATTFSIYDENGSLISTSKTYKEVLGVYQNYIAVIDTDNYLKLVNSDGSLVAKFVKWTDDMYFHSMLSGYYDEYKDIKGIYLVVQDNSIDATNEDEGYGYEYYYDIENKTTGKIATFIGGYAKPVLYLYPTEKTNITVTFKYPNLLTTTYPKFKDSWQVTAYPNGDLYDKKGNYYYALYWEELKSHDVDFNEGFYVTKDNAIEFLEEKLTTIGLNSKERNEFIMYWLPILEKNGQSLVYFELTEERDYYNKLIINPTPDSLLRVAIHVKKVAKKVNTKEQQLPTFKRTGFTAVEWGGVEH